MTKFSSRIAISLSSMFRFIFSKTFIIQLFLAAMVCSGAVVGAYFYLKSYTRQSDVVELPSLEGYYVFEADAFLGELELEAIIIDSLYLPEKHGGIIVNQEPIANSKVKKGRKIYFSSSSNV